MDAPAQAPPVRVLLVEDSATVRHIVRRALGGFVVIEALDGPAGVAAAVEHLPDVVLLDRYLPGQDGIEVLRRLVGDERTQHIPVVFLTGDDDPATLVTALEVGAHDFVRKPFQAQELLARVRGAARLKRLSDELRDAASRDPLTGLLNRRALLGELQRWAALHRRHGMPLAMLAADLSGFKKVNDEHGHAAGDEVLVRVGQLLQEGVRAQDPVARWGGDEFVVLLPHTDEAGARTLATRLADRVACEPVRLRDGRDAKVGITVGVAEGPLDDDGGDLLSRADEDLYRQRGDRER